MIQKALVVIIAVLVYFLTDNYSDQVRLCPRPDRGDYDVLANPQCSFSTNYYAARSLFRLKAKLAGADSIDTLEVDEQDDLTIDIAVFKGDPTKLVLQLSGVHGVEGFVGSSIQGASLTLQTQNQDFIGGKSTRPTVVMVHAVNPFGFANLRRWNEDGVDLNRNAMESAGFEKAKARDPNFAGYEDFDSIFNPPTEPSDLDWLSSILGVLPRVVTDFVSIKRALVTGTYTKPKSLFYGGDKMAKSHRLLKKWILESDFVNTVQHLVFIDIHTGLGPQGIDTLMHTSANLTLVDEVFVNKESNKYTDILPIIEGDVGSRSRSESDKAGASSGYDDVLGDTKHYYPILFPNLNPGTTIAATQEFGTTPGILVSKAMMQENQAWHYMDKGDVNRLKWQMRLHDVFNIRRHSFQKKVVERGVQVFKSAVNYLDQL